MIKVELEGFVVELIDWFGKLFKEVNILMFIVCIKVMCKWVGISYFDGGFKGVMIWFYNDKFVLFQGLVEFIEVQNGLVKVKDNKIVIWCDWVKDSDKIKGVFVIVCDLVEKVVVVKKKVKKVDVQVFVSCF